MTTNSRNRALLRFLVETGIRLRSTTYRQDGTAGAVSIYGLWVVAAAETYFRQLGLQDNVADRWRRLKQASKGVAAELNRTLDALSHLLNIPALAHHPDFLQFDEESLSNAIANIDVVDMHFEGPDELVKINEVLDAYIELQAPLANNSPLVTTEALNNFLASLLVHDQREVTSVYDPACGFGGSLLSLHSRIRERGHAGVVRFYGQDVNSEAVSITAWRFLLRGITNIELAVGDTLFDPGFHEERVLRQFDVVVASPPLYPTANADLNKDDPFHRFRYGSVNSSRADYGFVQHVLASTAPGGRSAVTLALSTLTRLGYEESIRSRIVHADLLDTVLALPLNVIAALNGSFNSSAVLLFDLSKPESSRDSIFFVDAHKVALEIEGKPVLTPKVAGKVLQIYTQRDEQPDLASWALLESVRARNYSLLPQLYIPQTPLALTSKETLESRIRNLDSELAKAIKEFNAALSSIQN